MGDRLQRFALSVGVVLVVVLAAGCGGEDDAIDPSTAGAWEPEALTIDADAPVAPILINSNLGLGVNRLAIAFVDQSGAPLTELAASATLFRLATDADSGRVTEVEEVLRTTLAGRVMTPALDHVHADGSVHVHSSGPTGVFVSEVAFNRSGWWGAAIESDRFEPMRLRFFVQERTREPAIGDRAPATIQPILRDVGGDVSRLDTSVPPNPNFHDRTVAEAIAAGTPMIVAFATPAFCQTQLCGPVLREAVIPIADEFGDAITVVHIEPFDLEVIERDGALTPVPALEEWGLSTEPWVFVIDAEGRVAAKFEGIVEADEIRTVLRRLLG